MAFARGNLKIHRPNAGRHLARLHLADRRQIRRHLSRPEKPLDGPGLYEIRGLAWTGNGKIRRVDVSTDGGVNWQTARLHEPVLSKALTKFTLPWRWDGQPALLESRVIDETGYVQPTITELRKQRGTNSVYHNNSIQTWQVKPDGSVFDVQLA